MLVTTSVFFAHVLLVQWCIVLHWLQANGDLLRGYNHSIVGTLSSPKSNHKSHACFWAWWYMTPISPVFFIKYFFGDVNERHGQYRRLNERARSRGLLVIMENSSCVYKSRFLACKVMVTTIIQFLHMPMIFLVNCYKYKLDLVALWMWWRSWWYMNLCFFES